MEKAKNISKEKGIERRSFLKWGCASLVSAPILANIRLALGKEAFPKKDLWLKTPDGKEYFVHDTVKTDRINDGILEARIDHWWRSYSLAELDDNFFNWYIKDKLDMYSIMAGEADHPMANGGHHHPTVATYGNRKGRGDSSFSLNTAIKGMALLPGDKYMPELISAMEAFKERAEAHDPDLAEDLRLWRIEIYGEKSLWDRTALGSLELFTGFQGFGFKETHTFLNMMENPAATIMFLDIWQTASAPCWEIRTIPFLSHHNNPAPVKKFEDWRYYLALSHAAYHGGSTNFIGCIYNVVEEFNNAVTTNGFGQRAVPPFTYVMARIKEKINFKLMS
jgi:hypothetical protein